MSCLTYTGAWQNMEGNSAPMLKGATWFSFDDIKIMTNNFNPKNELGEGGYGKVHHITSTLKTFVNFCNYWSDFYFLCSLFSTIL